MSYKLNAAMSLLLTADAVASAAAEAQGGHQQKTEPVVLEPFVNVQYRDERWRHRGKSTEEQQAKIAAAEAKRARKQYKRVGGSSGGLGEEVLRDIEEDQARSSPEFVCQTSESHFS